MCEYSNIYCASACAQLGSSMQCPTMRFATSTLSHLVFLILLLLVTFHFEDECALSSLPLTHSHSHSLSSPCPCH